jgi:chemotaxis signal transduction protein
VTELLATAHPVTAVEDADAVVVRLGTGRFALPLAHVAEVGKIPALTRVPGMPSWVAGVANWRGRVLAAIDLRGLLGADVVPFRGSARLVVVTTEVATVGLLVDGVDGTTFLGDDVQPFPVAMTGAGGELVSGQLPRDDGPVAVVDVDAVMRLRDSLPQRRGGA